MRCAQYEYYTSINLESSWNWIFVKLLILKLIIKHCDNFHLLIQAYGYFIFIANFWGVTTEKFKFCSF